MDEACTSERPGIGLSGTHAPCRGDRSGRFILGDGERPVDRWECGLDGEEPWSQFSQSSAEVVSHLQSQSWTATSLHDGRTMQDDRGDSFPLPETGTLQRRGFSARLCGNLREEAVEEPSTGDSSRGRDVGDPARSDRTPRRRRRRTSAFAGGGRSQRSPGKRERQGGRRNGAWKGKWSSPARGDKSISEGSAGETEKEGAEESRSGPAGGISAEREPHSSEPEPLWQHPSVACRTEAPPCWGRAGCDDKAGSYGCSARFGGAKRAYYAHLDGEYRPSKSWESIGLESSGSESCYEGPTPRRIGGRATPSKEEKEGQEEEEEKFQEKEEEETPRGRTSQPWRRGLRKQFFRRIQQQRVQLFRRKQSQLRQRVLAAAEAKIGKQAWLSATALAGSDRGELGRHVPDLGAWRNQGGLLLSPPPEGQWHGARVTGRKRTLSSGSDLGSTTHGPPRQGSRLLGLQISGNTTSGTGRPLERGSISGDPHPRALYSCWSRPDAGSSQTCQSGREGQRQRRVALQRQRRSRRLGRSRPFRLVLGLARRRRKRKVEERQDRKRKRRKLVRQNQSSVGKTIREGKGQERGEQMRLAEVQIAEGVTLVSPVSEKTPIVQFLLEECRSLAELGVGLWCTFLRNRDEENLSLTLGTGTISDAWWARLRQGFRACREKRALFPLPSIWGVGLHDALSNFSLLEILRDSSLMSQVAVGCWCELAVCFCNRLHGESGCLGTGPPSKPQGCFLASIERNIDQVLKDDVQLDWGEKEILEDFDKRLLSYTGEEVPKAEPLTVFRTAAALPPEGHGGCINTLDFVDGKTKWFLENPRSCLLDDVGQKLPKLQSRVHVQKGEELQLAKLLVDRGICTWVPEERVLRYRNEMVLNGMFGIAKSKILSNGQTSQRCIMNLIPSNSVLRTIPGRVHRLPNICQWLHVTLAPGEEVRLCQSDMVSAFYLFGLPAEWSELLCFNLSATSKDLGWESSHPGRKFFLGCQVLPMGWSSAVGVMQFIAEQVLYGGRIPKEGQLRRGMPLPEWLVKSTAEGREAGRLWWHVYLDNYASGEKVTRGTPPRGGSVQLEVERLWSEAKILASAGKTVKDAEQAQELGAHIGGTGCWMGASTERLQKLLKVTLWLLDKPRIPRRRLQMVMGRWVFAMQFRRPYMSNFHRVWEAVGGKPVSKGVISALRLELLFGCFGMGLLHTSMQAHVSTDITCSDASLSGGAVAISRQLSGEGKAFLCSQQPEARPRRIPVVLVSLFNGIGGAARCYDVTGVELAGMLFCEVHGPANRVSSRRWPNAVFWQDIRTLTRSVLEEKLLLMDDFEEVDVWAGFPCVDLSSARANRQNLAGESSSLVYEAVRVIKDLKALFPKVRIRKVIENVASMDVEVRDELSELLECKPIRVDPSRQIPMARPRLCWTDVEVFEVDGMQLLDKGQYLEMILEGDWPAPESWLNPGSSQVDPSVVYPTCMKCVPKPCPPYKPAGLERTDAEARQRWAEDQFRYPPYQHKEQYLVFDEGLGRCRLLDAAERERLMGYGAGHTSLAYSASMAKQQEVALEDERCSLVGDSFCIFSFMAFAAFAAFPWTQKVPLKLMNQRLGLAPGLTTDVSLSAPLSVWPVFPGLSSRYFDVSDLNAHLLQRTNHTGSDVRVTTGQLLSAGAFPRESVCSSWWVWEGIFTTRWKFSQHINALEARAIYLSLVWKARNLLLANRRNLHVTDSYVCLSILAKGRTSSKQLHPIVAKICALLLAAGGYLALSHVDSADNPTDEGSRKGEVKKKKRG